VLLDKAQKHFVELPQTDEAGKLPGKHALLSEQLPCKTQEQQKLLTHEVWHTQVSHQRHRGPACTLASWLEVEKKQREKSSTEYLGFVLFLSYYLGYQYCIY